LAQSNQFMASLSFMAFPFRCLLMRF